MTTDPRLATEPGPAPVVTLTVNPALDRTLTLGSWRAGAVNRVESAQEEAAGKGVNVTRALNANGFASVAVFPAGGATGSTITRLCSDAEVPAVAVPVAGNSRINTTVASREDTTKFNEPGPRLGEDELALLHSTVHRVLRESGARWLAVCGSLTPGLGPFFWERIRRVAEAEGAKLAVDTSGWALDASLDRGGVALAKPNDEELAELAGRPLTTVGDLVEAAWKQLARGNERLLVSLGADGALLVSEDDVWWAGAPPVAPVSTVAAGDSMLAGYLAHERLGPEAALRAAVAWGAAAVLKPGSGVPGPADLHPERVRTVRSPRMDQRPAELAGK